MLGEGVSVFQATQETFSEGQQLTVHANAVPVRCSGFRSISDLRDCILVEQRELIPSVWSALIAQRAHLAISTIDTVTQLPACSFCIGLCIAGTLHFSQQILDVRNVQFHVALRSGKAVIIPEIHIPLWMCPCTTYDPADTFHHFFNMRLHFFISCKE